jgi:hypothetical protein
LSWWKRAVDDADAGNSNAAVYIPTPGRRRHSALQLGAVARFACAAHLPATLFTPQTSGTTVPYDSHNHWTGAGYDPSGAGNMTSVASQG